MNFKRKKFEEELVKKVFFLFAFLSVITTFGIIFILIFETISFFKEVSIIRFFTEKEWTPLFVIKKFGIWPLLSGTFLTSFIALLIAFPMGIFISIFISEYLPPKLKGIIKSLLEILAGIPTVVYGYFALLYVTPILKKIIPQISGFNSLSPGIVLGIMIIPTIASMSEDAFSLVPMSLREASYALGASKLETSLKVILPAASSGVISSVILGFSRAIGETMIVTIAAGQRPILTLNPFVPIETITAYIVQVSLGDTPAGSLEYKTIFAVGMVLFVITLIFNILSHNLRMKFIKSFRI
ncbi:MAG: phosphate ABC transporter permease subunit PstC [candidate division WOR-3 bacterium]